MDKIHDKQFGITFGKEFGVKFGDNEKQLLLSLNSNPDMTAQNLADNLGITKREVEKQIKKLRELNVLTRQGSAMIRRIPAFLVSLLFGFKS